MKPSADVPQSAFHNPKEPECIEYPIHGRDKKEKKGKKKREKSKGKHAKENKSLTPIPTSN